MYRAAANAAPGDPEVQARYAAMLTRTGQPQEAKSVLSDALKRQPADPALLTALGNLEVDAGRPAEAITLFDRVLAHQTANAGALNGRGVALDLLGRHAEAQNAYHTILAADPTDVAAENNLAMSLMLQGRASEAVAILSSLSRRTAAPSRVITNLGLAQAAAGDRDAAQRTLAGRIGEADLQAITLGLSRPPG